MDRRKTERRGDGYSDIYVLDVAALGSILWRRKLLLLTLLLLVLVPGIAFIVMKPDVYRATASVIIENQELNLSDFKDVLPPGRFDEVTVETQARVIGSPEMIRQTLGVLNGTSPAGTQARESVSPGAAVPPGGNVTLGTFLSSLEVMPQGRSRLIGISYKSTDPLQAAEIANLHAEQYIQYQISNKKEQLKLLNDWINTQVDNLKKDGQAKSEAVQEFRKDAGIMLGKNSEDLIYEQISEISAQLVPVETQKLSLQARLDGLSGKGGQASLGEVVNSPLIQSLKAQASSAQQELKAMGSGYGPNHPDMLAAKRKVAQATADIGRETTNIRASVAMELEATQKQEQLLRDRLNELNQQAEESRGKSITLESLEAEETANRTLLDNFLSRAEEIKSQLDYTRADVSLASKADVPTEPIGTPKPLLMIVVALFALAFATGAVLLLELIDRGIENADDVRKMLNFKLLGMLPKAKNPLGLAATGARSPYMEEIRRIYLALSATKQPQSVMFTACRSGEGKSTTVAALGSYLASIKAKAILVDANASSPSLSTVTGVSATPGFADYIRGGVELGQIIQRGDDGLSVIAYGTDGKRVDLLASDAVSRMLTTLKAQYDLVLIDCAPIMDTTDAEIIAGLTDQSVLVIEWAKTPKKTLKRAAEILRQHARAVPGAILNKHR